MLHKEFFGFLFLGFIAWIFIAASPMKRIENLCRPVGWVGNATVSMSALVIPGQQDKVQTWFNKMEYGCQFVTWRMFYQEDYNKWLASQGQAPVNSADDVAALNGEVAKEENTQIDEKSEHSSVEPVHPPVSEKFNEDKT